MTTFIIVAAVLFIIVWAVMNRPGEQKRGVYTKPSRVKSYIDDDRELPEPKTSKDRYPDYLSWFTATEIPSQTYVADIKDEQEYILSLLANGTKLNMSNGSLQAMTIPSVAEMGDRSVISAGNISTEIRYDPSTGDVEISTYGSRGGLQSRVAVPDAVLLRALEMRGLVEAKPRR